MYASKMFGTCLGYANGRDQAKDILQDGFIKIFASIKNYNNNGSLEGWVRRIIVNTAIDYYRKSIKELNNVDIEEAENIDGESSILENIYEKELLSLIQKLPEGSRIIFNLYVIEGYSHLEISELLNISQGTSKSQFSRARLLLKEMIRQTHPNYYKQHIFLSKN
jgi:RNA polymerase sigma factor (sigma-70 family)